MKMLLCLLLLAIVFPGFILEGESDNSSTSDKDGQKSSNHLEYQVVVTATRTEQPILELASSTSLLTGLQLLESAKRNLVEALTAIPGLDIIQNGGSGAQADVFIRGANSEHTLIMIDGVEMNDPSSPGRTYDLGHLGLDNIDRIEVVRGPQSTLYGSDAIGGVINIISKKGAGKPKLFLSSEAGSFKSYKESAGLNGGIGIIDYSLGISRFDTEGFSSSNEKYGNSEKDGYGNTCLTAGLGIKPAENLDIRVMSRFNSAKNDLDNSAGWGGDDPNYISHSREFLLSGQARLLLLDSKWEQQLSISYNSIRRQYENEKDQLNVLDSSNGDYQGRRFKIDWQNNIYWHGTNTSTAGIEYEREQAESVYYWNSAYGPGESLFPGKSAHHLGFYVQDNIKIKDMVFIVLGVRLDNHSRFGMRATYRIAPAIILKTGTKLKATYGTGFKAPSLYHLYAPATDWGPMGNENLEPEKSIGWDIGAEQFFFQEKLSMSITYFHNDFNDLIIYDWSAGYTNVDQAVTKGIEMLISVIPLRGLSLTANYTITDTRDKATDEQLLRRPKHKANLTVNYRFFKDKIKINLDLIHVGKRLDVFPYPVKMMAERYTLIHLALSYRWNRYLELFGRIDNLMDKEYEAVMGYGTPGRSVYAGVRLNY